MKKFRFIISICLIMMMAAAMPVVVNAATSNQFYLTSGSDSTLCTMTHDVTEVTYEIDYNTLTGNSGVAVIHFDSTTGNDKFSFTWYADCLPHTEKLPRSIPAGTYRVYVGAKNCGTIIQVSAFFK